MDQVANDAAGRFRILCLDGGGIRGAFTASVISELERATGRRCADHFDLIVGTSTGGLLALGLAQRIPAEVILDFYREKGPIIFPHTSRRSRVGATFRQLFRNKLDPMVLRHELEGIFHAKTIGDSSTRLVIPAYDLTNGRVFVFKTCHLERFKFDIDVPAVEVGLCTSAAPTYFPANMLPKHADTKYVDGGVWANTPVLVGITEAIGFLGRSLEDLDVLSIGTTSPLPDFADQYRSGMIGWGPSLISLFMTAQAQSATAIAQVLCGTNYHRINATVPDSWMAMDHIRRIDELASAGRAKATERENLKIVESKFLNDTPVVPFVPANRLALPKPQHSRAGEH